MFTLNPKSTSPLVVQIVEGFRDLIQSGNLRPGSKAPSIRQFAHAHGVSVYTVVVAYDRLVAQGCFVSRPHSGFFVRKRGPRMRVEKGPGSGGTRRSDADFNMARKQQQERIDAILDKISRSGYDSLSKAERDFLFNSGNER